MIVLGHTLVPSMLYKYYADYAGFISNTHHKSTGGVWIETRSINLEFWHRRKRT